MGVPCALSAGCRKVRSASGSRLQEDDHIFLAAFLLLGSYSSSAGCFWMLLATVLQSCSGACVGCA
jgi:hypothetical protein